MNATPVLEPDYTHPFAPSSTPALQGHARTIMLRIVAAIKPRSRSGTTDAFNPEIESDLLHFVDHFVLHMPALMRKGFPLMLWLLEWLSVLYTRRRFSNLTADRALELCETWQRGRMAPLRELVKALRAITMAGVYSHPLVMEHIGYTPDLFVRDRIDWRRGRIAERAETEITGERSDV